MVIRTVEGDKVTIDPDKLFSIVMDNFSGVSKVKVDTPDGTQVYTIDETVESFMERLENA